MHYGFRKEIEAYDFEFFQLDISEEQCLHDAIYHNTYSYYCLIYAYGYPFMLSLYWKLQIVMDLPFFRKLSAYFLNKKWTLNLL